MRVRVITGVILSIFFASLVWVQGWYFRIVTMIATCFCMFELYDAFRKKGMKPIQWLCVAYPAALLGAYTLGRYMGHAESLMMPVMLMFPWYRWWSWWRARKRTIRRFRPLCLQ